MLSRVVVVELAEARVGVAARVVAERGQAAVRVAAVGLEAAALVLLVVGGGRRRRLDVGHHLPARAALPPLARRRAVDWNFLRCVLY